MTLPSKSIERFGQENKAGQDISIENLNYSIQQS